MFTAETRALGARFEAASVLKAVVAATAFAAALAVAAQVRIPLPFTPVPITLQTFALYIGAAWLGSRVATGGLALYVGGAMLGLPVMSGFRGGLAAFTGATGGYIVGWFLAAVLLGMVLGGRRRSWRVSLLALASASAIILFCGALHLALLFGLDPARAFFLGVAPFLPGDTLKIFAAAAIIRRWPSAGPSR